MIETSPIHRRYAVQRLTRSLATVGAKLGAILGLASLGYSAVATAQSKIIVIEQNGRTGYHPVSRVAVGQGSSRSIRITGKYLHLVSSATTTGGVSARSIQKTAEHQVTMVLDASSSSARGDVGLRLNIACAAPLPFMTSDCTSSVVLPVKVLETGPIASVAPTGSVPANAAVTFDVTGTGMGDAKLLARLMTLKNATVVQQGASVIRVRGTTPSCGAVVVALQDRAQLDDEVPYRKGSAVQLTLAGGVNCGGGPRVYSTTTCPVGSVWNASQNQCG